MSDLFGNHIVGFPHETAQMGLTANKNAFKNLVLVYVADYLLHLPVANRLTTTWAQLFKTNDVVS